MEAEKPTMAEKMHEEPPRFPRMHIDSGPLPTDSMVTVPLSEAATDDEPATGDYEFTLTTPRKPAIALDERRLSSRPTSAEILRAIREPRDSDASIDTPAMNSPTLSLPDEDSPKSPKSKEGSRSPSTESDRSAHVDWAELEKKEEQEPQEDGQDEVRLCRAFPDCSY
jgi:hypothetical protein